MTESNGVVLTARDARHRPHETDYAWAMRVADPYRLGAACCDRCDETVDGLAYTMDVALHRASPGTVLINLEIEHALAGCNGRLSWARP